MVDGVMSRIRLSRTIRDISIKRKWKQKDVRSRECTARMMDAMKTGMYAVSVLL